MRTLVFMVFSLLASCPSEAATHLLRADGNGDFPTIQVAINAATDGDTLELANGIYTGEGNRDITFFRSLTLRSSAGTTRGCVIDCEGSQTEPHRAFVFANPFATTLVEGITITNGYQDSGSNAGEGGAVRVAHAGTVQFRNCIFWRNHAMTGGAIDAEESGELLLENCDFFENSSGYSGAAIEAWNMNVSLQSCRFSEQESGLSGVGVGWIVSLMNPYNPGARIDLQRCEFKQNQGRALVASGSAHIQDSIFLENEGDDCGCNGIVVLNPRIGQLAVVEGCTFIGNLKEPTLAVLHEGPADVRRCTFVGNEGGIAAMTSISQDLLVENCIFYGNHQDRGIVLGAWQQEAPQEGNGQITARIENTIVVPAGDVDNYETAVHCAWAPTIEIICSNFLDGWHGCVSHWKELNGNIDADPAFCDARHGDFRLQADSPCLPENNGCGLIGIYGVGCEATATAKTSFSAIKLNY